MKLKKASLCLSALLALGGCDPEDPPKPPPTKTPQLTTVTVTCEPASLVAGQSAQCTASATDEEGKPFTVSSYSWTSNNESVAKVDSTGKATTFTAGTANIGAGATAGGVTKQGQATLTVIEKTTLHTTPITTNETWRVADNPHVVRGQLEVTGASNPTLTLEAGVTIRFEQDAALLVTKGALQAVGTQTAPIRMVAAASAPTKGYWRGVVFATEGSASKLDNVTLSHCGRNPDPEAESACIIVRNKAAPILVDTTVQNSGTAGVMVARDGSAFGVGSAKLSVLGSEGYAVTIDANEAGTLPTGGTFSDNKPNAVELRGLVERTQTWPKLSIPYVVDGFITVGSAAKPTLTLLPGTEVRFNEGYEMNIGRTSDKPGILYAEGNSLAPIRFVPNSNTPSKGFWSGLHFWWAMGSKLDTVVVSHAGREGLFSSGLGNVNVYREEVGEFVFNSTLSDSSGCGITVSKGDVTGTTAVTTDFTGAFYANVFNNNTGGSQCTQ